MELLQLQYFRTVARLEHMTKAAQQLHIAQPALSKTIARLEEDLGVPLFDRSGRTIRLNAYGEAFIGKMEAALSALEEGRKEVAALAGLAQGSIRLATSTLDMLSEPLSAFVQRHPGIDFRITQAAMEEMTLLLENGEIDLCITALPVEHPSFRAVSMVREEVYLAVPPGHRFADREHIRLSEAAHEPFIGYKEGMLFQPMNDELCREAGFAPRIVCRVDEPSAISSLVRAGLGVALIGGCGRAPSSKLKAIAIESPVCQRNFRVLWHDKRVLSAAAQKFKDYLVHYYEETGSVN